MNKMAANPENHLPDDQILRNFLTTAKIQFQNGEDAEGIESLLSAVVKLENLVVNDRNSRQPRMDLNLLLPVARKLYFYVHNRDIPGIADILEEELCPMTAKWLKGSDDI